jgi:hypothetical protein
MGENHQGRLATLYLIGFCPIHDPKIMAAETYRGHQFFLVLYSAVITLKPRERWTGSSKMRPVGGLNSLFIAIGVGSNLTDRVWADLAG